jgi:hypothetical protein
MVEVATITIVAAGVRSCIGEVRLVVTGNDSVMKDSVLGVAGAITSVKA